MSVRRRTPVVRALLCALGVGAAAGCDEFALEELGVTLVTLSAAPTAITLVSPTAVPAGDAVCDGPAHTSVTVTRGDLVQDNINFVVGSLPSGVEVAACVYLSNGEVERKDPEFSVALSAETSALVSWRIDLFFEVAAAAQAGDYVVALFASLDSGDSSAEPVSLTLTIQAPAVTPEVTIVHSLMNNGLAFPGAAVLLRADVPGLSAPSFQWSVTSVEGTGVYDLLNPTSAQARATFTTAGTFGIQVEVNDPGSGFSGMADMTIVSTYVAFDFTVTASGVQATPQREGYATRWELVDDLTQESVATQAIEPGGSESFQVDGLAQGGRYRLRLYGRDPDANEVVADQVFVVPQAA